MKRIYDISEIEDREIIDEESGNPLVDRPVHFSNKSEQDDLSFLKSKWAARKVTQFRKYPQFYYDKYNNIDFSDLNEKEQKTCKFQYCETLSATGSISEFDGTRRASNFHILNFDNTFTVPTMGSQGPVSFDENIENLAREADFDIVVHLSTVHKIMDNFNWQPGFDIPVIIKNVDTGSTTKKIIFVDKTILLPFVPAKDIISAHVKRLIKRTYCCSSSKKVTKEGIQSLFAPREKVPESLSFEENDMTLENGKKVYAKNTIYNLWNMSTSEIDSDTNKPKELKILMRCKLDAFDEDERRGISYFPKLNTTYHNTEQLIKRWGSLFFRPNTLLYDINIVGNKFVADLEKLELDDLSYTAEQYFNFAPESKFLVVSKIFEELVNHEVGSYILRYREASGPYVALLKALTDADIPEMGNIYDLYDEYNFTGFYVMLP